VRIAGRKEVVGKPFLYATTREFLVHFGLNSLRDLPPLEEFEETFGAALGATERAARAGEAEPGAGAATEQGAGEEGAGWGGRGWAPEVGEGVDASGGEGDHEDGEDGEDREERFLREAAELEQREEREEREEPEAGLGAGAAGWEPAGEDELAVASWDAAVEEDLADGDAETPGEAETAAAGSKAER